MLPSSTSVLDIQFFIGNPVSSSPSKPQDLRVGLSGGHPLLTWALMQEPDVQSGGSIRIERRLRPLYSGWSNWSEIGSTAGNATSFIDYGIQQGCQGNCPDSVQYRIRAVDNTSKYSVYSDPASKTYYYFKQGTGENQAEIPTQFELAQNYPNPFNPTTTLSYALARDVHVSLRVFDVLGRVVLDLVDQDQKAGRYELQIDALHLASGIYIYKLQAGPFTDSKRMLLLK